LESAAEARSIAKLLNARLDAQVRPVAKDASAAATAASAEKGTFRVF
jgi:hypothetical protein